MIYLLDTNHAYQLLDKQSVVYSRAATSDYRLCTPVAGELWFMVCNSARPTSNSTLLQALLDRVPVVSFDQVHAAAFGVIRTELRRAGRAIPQIDIQIAAIARVAGWTIATADNHFSVVDHLLTENWLTP